MEYLVVSLVSAFILGCVFGSFYNVVIYRLPAGLPIARGRSMCTSCNTTLRARDLVPVFSQLLLRGRCRYCGERISWRYTVIELLTGALFALAWWLHGWTAQFFLTVAVWSLLLMIAIIDYQDMDIYNSTLVALFVPGVLSILLIREGGPSWQSHLVGAAIGFGFYGLIYVVALLVFKQEAFGGGDVWLMGLLGLYLGGHLSAFTCLLAFYLAMLYIILLRLFRKQAEGRTAIPFGPFICAAAFLATIFGEPLLRYYLAYTWIPYP